MTFLKCLNGRRGRNNIFSNPLYTSDTSKNWPWSNYKKKIYLRDHLKYFKCSGLNKRNPSVRSRYKPPRQMLCIPGGSCGALIEPIDRHQPRAPQPALATHHTGRVLNAACTSQESSTGTSCPFQKHRDPRKSWLGDSVIHLG